MMVTFVSQCEKKALQKTRRVLDAFANRIGSRTWQTVITNEGLQAVKKLLRKSASKNTAVSCFWIRSRSRSELVWIVGNRNKFNHEGYVPVNYTEEDGLLNNNDEAKWKNVEVISILAGIAGLFHDLGKANKLFQYKLDKTRKGKNYEPYRHEWVSLRLFNAFIKTYTVHGDDKEWLKALSGVDNTTESEIVGNLVKDSKRTQDKAFRNLPKIAKIIAWLIVSHHRLPVYPANMDTHPEWNNIDNWLDEEFESLWNSPFSHEQEWENGTILQNWQVEKKTPFNSAIWQIKARNLAKKALDCPQLPSQDWFKQLFVSHLSRLSLMLADHYYSALTETTPNWQDPNYYSIANTDNHRNPKQKLDEHNIGVSQNAMAFARKLPQLERSLPTITKNRKFTDNVPKKFKEFFGWQDKSYKCAKAIQKETKEHGFFGINMASTGRGKTLGNARIMYALADEKKGCRFNIALGLRTLTLQTGRALADMLELKKEDYAVLIGSRAVKKLYDKSLREQQKEEQRQFAQYNGSESSEGIWSEDQQIDYGGVVNNEILSKWLKKSSKLQSLIEAPLLISTIDHLIPATEGTRGGKQIAPMLRLLTSDLVLDEPDDFGLEDMPALCRLVNWTAMLGGKVLLSTATMPPALSYALFLAYQAGWQDYTEVNGQRGKESTICCGWFDEFNTQNKLVSDLNAFRKIHDGFVKKRIKLLANNTKPLCKASLVEVDGDKTELTAIQKMAHVIHRSTIDLHDRHNQEDNKGTHVSIGLVRFANINPLVAVAKELLTLQPPENTHIHYCVYHARYPLVVRSYIEERLDAVLTRNNESEIWTQLGWKIKPGKNNIFVVLATSVAEVGRDHDYDWAIAEPSSMRSLIQLAGRIQRHRKEEPKVPNMLILSTNFKGLQGKTPAYAWPGFETRKRCLASHDLCKILNHTQYEIINAIPRIQFSPNNKMFNEAGYLNLVELEHVALFERLLGMNGEVNNAKAWWEFEPAWCGELQRRQRFRRSEKEETFCLYLEHEDCHLQWQEKNDSVKPVEYKTTSKIRFVCDCRRTEGNHIWFEPNIGEIYKDHCSDGIGLKDVSRQLAEIHLRKAPENKMIEWQFHPALGVFEEI